MLSDTFENPRPQTVGDVRAAICSGPYSLWNPAFLHLFFLFLSLLAGGRQVPSLFLVFLSDVFPQVGMQEAMPGW